MRGQVSRRKVIEHAEDDAAQNGAAHLIEAADDGGDERRHAERLTIGEFRQIDRADQDRRDGDEHGIDEKRIEHHPPHRDAEDERQRRILCGRLHRAAQPRLVKQQMQRDDRGDGDHKNRHALR